jgi:hypothetical protein
MYLGYLSGNPINISGVGRTHDGLPKILGSLIPNIRKGGSPDFLRVLNTVLWSTRYLCLGKKPDISPIQDGPKCGYPSGMEKYSVDF